MINEEGNDEVQDEGIAEPGQQKNEQMLGDVGGL
jgi:hypothetical protein